MKNKSTKATDWTSSLCLHDYRLDKNSQCWLPKIDRPDFHYSDGDEFERHIFDLIKRANDITVLSTELRQYCTDWPSLYHLASRRANILRPFEADLHGDILEIGAGCGAITRYLGECGGNIIALEGSHRRASIARLRTRDLPNVTVIVDNFNFFYCDQKFDFITLIGVLEYANLFSSHENPALSMLQHAHSLLKPNGKLLIAIENQLGLKYFAGAPEDHIGKPMYGIENRYKSDQPQTHGYLALTGLLTQANFNITRFFIPFPDYKLPISIITPEGIGSIDFDASALAWQNAKCDPLLPKNTHFSLELAWPIIFSNNLALDMANSFLVLASHKPSQNSPSEEEILAYHYSTDRRPEYCKETVFLRNHTAEIIVKKNKLREEADQNHYCTLRKPKKSFALQHQKSDTYLFGDILASDFIYIVTTDGWSLKETCSFLHRYISILECLINQKDDYYHLNALHSLLPGTYLDATPKNIIVLKNKAPVLIDNEWVAFAPIELGYLLFRSLLWMMGMITRFGKSSCLTESLTYNQLIKLILEAINFNLTDQDYKRYLNTEIAFQIEATGYSINIPSWLEQHVPTLNTNEILAKVLQSNQELKYWEPIINNQPKKSNKNPNPDCVIKKLHNTQNELKERIKILEHRELELTNWINMILSSISWKATKPLRLFGVILNRWNKFISKYSISDK